MELMVKKLVFLIKTFSQTLKKSNNNSKFWQFFEKNVTRWSKITQACFIYLKVH